jgi:serine phosphatase RsbU (regulator of sigma subunit)
MILNAMIDTAVATLLAAIGLLAIAVGLRWRASRTAGLLLGIALVQSSVIKLADSPVVRDGLVGSREAWMWVAALNGYLILIPWTMLVEQVLGRGWGSSLTRIRQAFVVAAVAAIACDLATGRPGTSGPAFQALVVVYALVFLINLTVGPGRMARDLAVLRVGCIIFTAIVIHDALAYLGMLPWRRTSGLVGLLVFVGCLAYTVLSRTLRGQRHLQAIEHELEMARQIQASLLPRAAPVVKGASIAFRHLAAAAVAGDIFEFLGHSPGGVGILVADVSGHGVPAALIASMVKVAAAAQKPHAADPARVLAGIHLALASELPPGQFVTAVYVYVDLERSVLRHASAGHPPALVRDGADAKVSPAGPGGPLLISFAPAHYPLSETPLARGSRVLLYTDGVIEAMRSDGEMFGVDRLSAVVATYRGDVDGMLAAVVRDVTAFSGRKVTSLEDDCTMVAIQVEEAATWSTRRQGPGSQARNAQPTGQDDVRRPQDAGQDCQDNAFGPVVDQEAVES